ncbi:MAG: ABC transporter ATP-binding protein/permease [Alphaproteobacteria bacterium]|nr:ABC transporter ATP-binding protein/permease [Alphaproteobacteria bacterium]
MSPPHPLSGGSADPQPKRFQLGAIRTLLPHLWPRGDWELRVRVVLALLCLAVAKGATVYVPLFYKQAIDALTPAVGTHAAAASAVAALPVGMILAYGAARVMSQLFAELRDFVFAKVQARAIRKVALGVFRHLHALSLRFHIERQTGGLSRAIERGTNGIDNLLSFTLFNIAPTLLEILLVCGVLWGLYDISFAAVTFVTIVAYIAYTLGITEWRIKFRRQMNESDTQANTKAIDSLLNYETVKYFGNEEHEARRYDQALVKYEKASVKSHTTLSLLNIGQGAIIAVGVTIIMLMAGSGVVAGRMTPGDFVLVNTYLIQLYMPLNFLGFVYREIKQSLIDMEAMFRLLDVPEEVADLPGAPALAVSGGTIQFDDVFFSYDKRRPILKGVSFTVQAGHKIAIVGTSGSGKSTIARLLFRFYDVSAGAIRIDGQDIREATQASVRAAMGVVPQDTVLFNDTIYYNIAYGRPDASREEIEEAARLAQIDRFVRALPDGYDSMVGERGLKLSGGEKQRVAIARTILKNPRIMIFDEATSALDSHTEREIQASLGEIAANHTALVIAHRLSTVIDADEILVLEHGEVVERGRHADLLRLGGRYAAMWQKQQEAAEKTAADGKAADVAAA